METRTQKTISNLEYDLLTALHNKAEAVNAYDQYIQDAQQMNSQPCVQLFEKLKQQDLETSQEIRHHLMQVMQHGRM